MRAKALADEADFKKREAYMKEQWLRDLQDKERSEEEWENKVEELTHVLKEKDAELRDVMARANQQESELRESLGAKEAQAIAQA